MRHLLQFVCVAAIQAAANWAAGQPADLIIHGKIIHTGVEGHSPATHLAIRSGRIVAIGDEATVEPMKGPSTQTQEFPDGAVFPGLIDAHGHMSGLGSFGFGLLDLSSARSFDDVIAAIGEKAKSARKGEWIIGGRWDHESWPGKQLPTHDRLSAATPENPVWLRRVDGHAGLANALAMKIAGVTSESQNPPGGEVIRDSQGKPTGVFLDNAMDPLSIRAGGVGKSQADLILKAQEMCLAAGLTGVHDAGLSPTEISTYRELEQCGKLKLRIYGMIAGEQAQAWFAKNEPYCGPRFCMRACKLYMDGAMGSRGAWLLDPYEDRPIASDGTPYRGLNIMSPEFVREIAIDGARRGYQVCTHAIGDRANREVLDAYQLAFDSITRSGRRPPDWRYRIEHAQLLSPADIPRFSALGVIASMQPTHCSSDMRWVESRIGPVRAKGAYAWSALLNSRATLAFGSDFPVESHNPMLGIHAAVTRQNLEGSPVGGWRPEQKLTRAQALRAFTLDAARAGFQEKELGSLEIGKFADVVVFDRDWMSCPPSEIPGAKVLATMIAGDVVYKP